MSQSRNRKFAWLSLLFPRRRHGSRGNRSSTLLALEPLEGRRLLTACSESPAIQGTVFLDPNQNGQPDTGEAIANAAVRLFLDDGDGIPEDNGDDVFVEEQLTNSQGLYCFDNLDGTAGYFVHQPSQSVGGIPLPDQLSPLILPGVPNLVVDQFLTSQAVEASPPPPSAQSNTLSFPNENEVIGAERDLFVELTSGASEVRLRVNPFGLLPVLQFDATSGVQGRSIVTWDGADGDGSPIPSMGLGGRDLTEQGQNVGFAMNLGIDPSGSGEQVTVLLYQGNASNVSTASAEIPVTDGTATAFLFLPFSSFSGPVSPTDVDAIQLLIGNGVSSADGQIDVIGIVGPKVQDFANPAVTDLSIAKTNNVTTVVPGESVVYSIIVQNLGPLDVAGAVVQDVFPAELTNVSYTSTTSGTASGNTPAGTGNINDIVDLATGASITYTVTATVAPDARGTLSNTATVTLPDGTEDPTPENNTSTARDTLTPELDLRITKDDGLESVSPGGQLVYTIVVSNPGPSTAQGARITDVFPVQLTNVSYTSTTVGTVSGNTAVGTGNIDDTVVMGVNSEITYIVTTTVSGSAAGIISNAATVVPPDGTTDRNPDNNQDTDTTSVIRQADLAITKTNGQSTVVPGETISYTIVAQNLGPGDVTGATIQDTFPAQLSNVTYVSTTTGTVSGNTPSGSGNLDEVVNMASGSTITYTVTATVIPGATGQLQNTATIATPVGVTDPVPDNNSSTDTDTLTPEVDLVVTKSNSQSTAIPAQPLTYTITVSNTGPSHVVGAQLVDVFPAELTNVSYTSSPQGGATGNTANGTGNINDTLSLPVGASVTYNVTSIVRTDATQDVTNQATITPPANVTDRNPANNTATHTDELVPGVDLVITKTADRTTVGPSQPLTYTIVVRNDGPNPVENAQVIDVLPGTLNNISYTSQATAGASGNTASGTGNINDSLDLAVGSRVTYTVIGTVADISSGTVVNTATVTPPENVTEINP